MTWVVGMATTFGSAVALSDVRITLQDGSEIDCLQKIYAVAPNVAVGFAGSVALGFRMVHRIHGLLKCDPGEGWIQPDVIGWLPSQLQHVFFEAPQSERGLGCALLMISVHPSENQGESPWPRAYLSVFRAPTFEPANFATSTPAAIGSGADVFQDALAGLVSEDEDRLLTLMKVEGMVSPAAMLAMLGHELKTIVEAHQPDGISPHFQLYWVSRSGITLSANDSESYGSASKPERTVFKMPPLVRGPEQLEVFLRKRGFGSMGCTT